MLPEETLTEIEILNVQRGVYPCDVAERLFYSFPCLRIVKNYLARPCLAVRVNLPENGCALPVLGGADMVSSHQFHCLVPPESEAQETKEIVGFVVLHARLYHLIRDERCWLGLYDCLGSVCRIPFLR